MCDLESGIMSVTCLIRRRRTSLKSFFSISLSFLLALLFEIDQQKA